ncbi:MAG: hypothetical protein ABH983_02950, partial [Candidatus Micrarchaeota archaeon]
EREEPEKPEKPVPKPISKARIKRWGKRLGIEPKKVYIYSEVLKLVSHNDYLIDKIPYTYHGRLTARKLYLGKDLIEFHIVRNPYVKRKKMSSPELAAKLGILSTDVLYEVLDTCKPASDHWALADLFEFELFGVKLHVLRKGQTRRTVRNTFFVDEIKEKLPELQAAVEKASAEEEPKAPKDFKLPRIAKKKLEEYAKKLGVELDGVYSEGQATSVLKMPPYQLWHAAKEYGFPGDHENEKQFITGKALVTAYIIREPYMKLKLVSNKYLLKKLKVEYAPNVRGVVTFILEKLQPLPNKRFLYDFYKVDFFGVELIIRKGMTGGGRYLRYSKKHIDAARKQMLKTATEELKKSKVVKT